MTNHAKPELTYVYVSPDQGTWLKVTWTWKGQLWPAYSIDRDLIQRVSNEVRSELRSLVQHAIKNGEDGCKRSGAILKAIATSGHKLYLALFHGEKGQGNPERIRKWLAGRPEKLRITFVVDERVHIPWGLVYDSDPNLLSRNPEDIDLAHYPDFWCVKYCLASVYSRIDPSILTGPKNGDRFRVLPVVNQQAFEKAFGALTPEEQGAIKGLLSSLNPPVYRTEDMFARCGELDNSDCLLYFYCHADGANLSLGINERVSIDDLKLRWRRNDLSSGESTCIVFLNGCHTAAGDPGGGFLEATGGTGFCGFIGTETEIPDVFALRFGSAFLYEILRGGTVTEVMFALRTKHWPLSLVYGTYCAEIQLTPNAGVTKIKLPEEPSNFATSGVGTEGMDV
jgi:hypothetical protein